MGSEQVVRYIEAGLAAARMRSKVTANNIANAQTPGYRRYSVEFEQLLSSAMKDDPSFDPRSVEPELFQPQNTKVDSTGNDVNLDVEVGEMVKNSARYRTYMRLLNRIYRQMETATRTTM
jgi:flagellar basal-body rod protein FlgB